MIKLDFQKLAEMVDGKLVREKFSRHIFEGVSIDSRSIVPGQLFIAIKGEKDDGHKYIGDVVRKSGGGLIVGREYGELDRIAGEIPIIVVDDPHRAMMQLAKKYRARLTTKVVAITGSNGKTTTKEFVFGMINSRERNTYRSAGNLNNLFGLPLAILAMPQSAPYGIFELGISVPGEMTQLAQMIVPDLAVITNIGPTHLETLGTVAGVAEAKFELVDNVDPSCPILLNADNEVLMQAASRRRRKFVTYAIEKDADFTARRRGLSDDGYPLVEIDGALTKVRLFGEHQAYNILAGYAVCRTLGLDLKVSELEDIDYRFAPYRGEIENISGLILIADCYNANPESLRSGLISLRHYLDQPAMKGRRGIVVVGDMLELGTHSARYHREIGKLLAELHFDMNLVVGAESAVMHEAALEGGSDSAAVKHFADADAAGEYLLSHIRKGDVVYLKASRGISLDKIVTLLKGTAFRQN